MSGYFYIQSELNNLVVTVEGFQNDGWLTLYPAYGGANQLWKWGANNRLVSKMGLVADTKTWDETSKCIANPPLDIDTQK